MIVEWLNWLKLKLTLETQMKGLLSNINPKIHFFNYSADVNPFLHCGSGIIDANFKWECLKKKSEVIWRNKFVQRWCPNYFLPFLDQQVSCFYETAESISVKTVQIHGIWTRYSESLISEFSLSVLILSCSLSFNSPRYKGKKLWGMTAELLQKPWSGLSYFSYWGTFEKTISGLKSIPSKVDL